LVIDEESGFIGGVNIRRDMREWYDINIRIQGNAVHSLLRAFAKGYVIAGGDKENVRHLLKYTFRVEKDIQGLEFIYDDPHSKRSRARKRYTEALLKARERVILFSPYYFPDRKFLKALYAARKRGVRVDLLIPFRSDVRIAHYAAYAWFSLMNKSGVRVHLLKNMMHGKGVVVDDDWAMIGSSNIDQSSFYDLYEVNAKISDKRFVKKIKKILDKWLKDSELVDGKTWKKRGVWQRCKEWMALNLYRIWHRRG
jgi:cardiolipin synthase